MSNFNTAQIKALNEIAESAEGIASIAISELADGFNDSIDWLCANDGFLFVKVMDAINNNK